MNFKVFAFIICYGVFVTFFSYFEWPDEGIHYTLNLPGNLLAESIYSFSIESIGEPSSSQANYTIPWILRVPQLIVPVSMCFWTGCGAIIQVFFNRLNYWNKSKNHSFYFSGKK